MFSRNRAMTLGATAALALLLALAWGGVAQERDRADGAAKADKSATAGHVFKGRIARVNADTRLLVLNDVQPVRPTPRDARPGAGAAPDRERPRAVEAPRRSMTFMVTKDAQISLDGRKADLKDLKEGNWARVRALPSLAPGAGARPPAGAAERPGERPGVAAVMRADRVEAFTKAFGDKATTSTPPRP
jgi:hypothetical protein